MPLTKVGGSIGEDISSLPTVTTLTGSEILKVEQGGINKSATVDDVADSVSGDIASNTAHRLGDGSDHSFIDQDITVGSSPTFNGLTVNDLTTGQLFNIKYVSTKSDFPTPSGGIITLAPNTKYVLVSSVSLGTDSITPASGSVNVITSDTTSGNSLSYTGTGAMFVDSALTGSLFITQIQITTPNGSVCNIQDTTLSGTGTILFETMQFILCASMGTVTNVRYIAFFSQEVLCGQGWVFTDNDSVTYTHMNNQFGLNIPGTTLMEFNGNMGAISLNDNFFSVNSNETLFDIKASSTTTGAVVVSTQVELVAAGATKFAASSKDQEDPFWTYNSNPGLPDSTISSEGYLTGNVNVTVIPTVNSWVIIEANGWTNELSERFNINSEGIGTYTGIEDATIELNGNIGPDPVLSNKELSARFCNIHSHDDLIVTFDNTTNTVLEAGTVRVNGDQVSFINTAGTLPIGLEEKEIYFVGNVIAGTSFNLYYEDTLSTLVTFTDNGAGTNSYNYTELRGSDPQQNIVSNVPRDLAPTALVNVETGDQIAVCLQNRSDAVNINCTKAYYRVKK